MSRGDNSTGNVLKVAFYVCLFCGLFVSAAAVMLRPLQEENRLQFRQINVLRAAGIYEPGLDVEAAFQSVQRRFVELESGEYVDMPPDYDPMAAARDPGESYTLSADPAGIRRQVFVAEVFEVYDEEGELERIILPIHGYGLWSTMYGFLALAPDGNTITGVSFYDHAETPGLGGEIENPRWQQLWEGTRLLDEDGNIAFQVVKRTVDPDHPRARTSVDGITGATLTMNGVSNMVRFWAGDEGFGSYLGRMRQEHAAAAELQ
jgi:Na+-transporting NADH:ubiquinone oxidoreductase subunit C